jgi:hypothetical protein
MGHIGRVLCITFDKYRVGKIIVSTLIVFLTLLTDILQRYAIGFARVSYLIPRRKHDFQRESILCQRRRIDGPWVMKIGHLWVAGSYIATSDLLLNANVQEGRRHRY